MRIGIVYYGIHPFNRGIDQLARILSELGHKPQVVARSHNDQSNHEEVNGTPLIQVPLKSTSRFRDALLYHFPFNPFWKNLLVKIGRQEKWEAIIVRETPLAWPSLMAARILKIPAYLDMRENLAAMYQAGRARNFVLGILRKPSLIKGYEQLVVPRFKHTFVVSPELKDWLTQTYNVSLSHVSVLENTPSEQFLEEAETAYQQTNKPDNVFRFVFAGNIRENRGVGDIIEALPLVLKENPAVRLRIIGEGSYLTDLKQRIAELNLNDSVEFYPMLSQKELIHRLAECHIGLEPYRLSTQGHLTVPGKLFEYMALGLPVFSSARRPTMRILEDTNSGWVFQSRNHQEIGNQMVSIAKDKDTVARYGENAQKAVLSRYNWKNNLEILDYVFPKKAAG